MTARRRAGSDVDMRFENDKQRRAFGRAAVVGIEFAVAVVACLLGGYWLDQRYNTEPAFTLAGLVLGSVTGFRILWKLAKESERDMLD